MKEQLVIREMEERDKDKVIELLNLLAKYQVDNDMLGIRKYSKKFGHKYYQDFLLNKNMISIVACHGHEIIGLIIALVIKNDGYKSELFRDEYHGYFEKLFVLDNYRKYGVGRSLAEFAEKILKKKGCNIIKVSVKGSNDNAAGFYNKLGFTEVSKNLYKRLS